MNFKIILLFFLTSYYSYGQVGVNTSYPAGIFHVDGRADNDMNILNITDQQAQNDFLVTPNGYVGIGTVNPSYKLTVNGTVKVDSIKNITNTNTGYSPQSLMINKTTGEISSVTSVTGNIIPINYITYQITSGSGDWIKWFDTKIDSTNYMVAIVGFTFNVKDANNAPVGLVTGSAIGGTFVPPTVKAYIDPTVSSTWLLNADFVGAAPLNNVNGTWTINCLVINKLLFKNLGKISQSFGGTISGTAPKSPPGL